MKNAKHNVDKDIEETTLSIVDIDELPAVNHVKVEVNGKETPLAIGDKIVYPEDSDILKTIVSLTVFEDGTVNYMLKWFNDGFKSELVSLTDLKLLKQNSILRKPIGGFGK